MMLGASPLPENFGGAAAAVPHQDEAEEIGGGAAGGGAGSVSAGEEGRAEGGERNFGGNRWPREETLALLRIRSEMDVAFRDASLKAPLWEDVSRKLAEMGFRRTPKKCKEKFENIYKYHRRTKEGRSGRQNGKTYRFFDQLEALEAHLLSPPPPPPQEQLPYSPTKAPPVAAVPAAAASPPAVMAEPINAYQQDSGVPIIQNFEKFGPIASASTSSEDKDGDGDVSKEGNVQRRKKKRKLSTGFFERMLREVIEKQENLQRQFLEAIERCEIERRAREDAWRMQELAKIKREQELLAQERAVAAAKDAAVIALLQKISGGKAVPPEIVKPPPPAEKIVDQQQQQQRPSLPSSFPSSSRWPKEEVEALIKLRTDLDAKYLEIGSKGALWEEVSAAMAKLGYDRSSKRCKEKWENINKYFKRVKESNRKRPEDSKTCPYFHQLDALYREKHKLIAGAGNGNTNSNYSSSVSVPSSGYRDNAEDSMLKPEELLMQMVGGCREESKQDRDEVGSENTGQNRQEETEEDEEEEEEDEEGGNNADGYQIVANNSNAADSSMVVMS